MTSVQYFFCLAAIFLIEVLSLIRYGQNMILGLILILCLLLRTTNKQTNKPKKKHKEENEINNQNQQQHKSNIEQTSKQQLNKTSETASFAQMEPSVVAMLFVQCGRYHHSLGL